MQEVEEMRSLSSVVKSAHVIMDNKKFVLSSKITMPEIPADEMQFLEREMGKKQSPDEVIQSAHDEARKIIEQAMEEAQVHINEAKDEAQRIISDGMDQSKDIKDKARMEGYEDGQQEGFNEGRQIAEALIQEAMDIKSYSVDFYKQLIDNAEAEVIDMTLEISSKILNSAMTSDEYILGLVQEAVRKCTYTTSVILRVSEEDYPYVVSEKNKILVLCQTLDDIEIKIDRSLVRGGCVLETPTGMIDASIQTQLDYVRNRFEEMLKSE